MNINLLARIPSYSVGGKAGNSQAQAQKQTRAQANTLARQNNQKTVDPPQMGLECSSETHASRGVVRVARAWTAKPMNATCTHEAHRSISHAHLSHTQAVSHAL